MLSQLRWLLLGLALFAPLLTSGASAQVTGGANAQLTTVPDSLRFTLPPGDSVRILDSIYRARRALLEKWAAANRSAPHPQDDFLSIYANLGGVLRIRANDINQYFSERAGRPDPASDRENYSSVDRFLALGGQAQLARTWGIYIEYNFTQKVYNTLIDDTLLPALHGAVESFQLTEHSIVTGGMMILLSSAIYRLRANGGIGAVYARTYEEESGSNATRSATAIGYQFNFDLINDFRFAEWGSFNVDLLSRSVSTSTIKTADGQTLQTPFGLRTAPLSIAPRASNLTFGFAAGLVIYF